MKKRSEWIDRTLLDDFEAQGTDAHRLCTIEGGWVERFGSDILISFKEEPARERLIPELYLWAAAVGFKFGRWVDSVIMQRPLGPGDATPPAPLSP